MTNIKGTNVASGIVPFTTEDRFPTHYSKYGKGGWREVDTIAERDSIPEARRSIGMIVYVVDNNIAYILKGGLTNDYWFAADIGGSSANDKTYVYDHTETASETWEISHNLGKYPSVTVVDTAGTIIECEVKYLSINTILLNFFSGTKVDANTGEIKDKKIPQKGKAYLN